MDLTHRVYPLSRLAVLILCLSLIAASQAQTPSEGRPHVSLPRESAGIDGIARALIRAFDEVDIVALGEAHERRIDSDLRIALVRSPEFARKVHFVLIECASITEQATLDRYIEGGSVPARQLARVWQATSGTTNGFCDAPIYHEFLAAIRAVNAHLLPGERLRVLAGHPGPTGRGIEGTAIRVLREHALGRHFKALLIYGTAHFFLDAPPDYYASAGGDSGLARRLNRDFPGRTLTVIPVGSLPRPPAVRTDVPPDYRKFDQALLTSQRPVLVSLQRPPFRDLSAEEFLGRTLTTCRNGCQSVFKGSTLTLGQMADAAVYLGAAATPRSSH